MEEWIMRRGIVGTAFIHFTSHPKADQQT